jgi:hypothetical protein
MAHTYGGIVLTRSSAATSPIARTATAAVVAADTVLVLELTVVGATNRAGGAPTWNGVAGQQANTTQKAAASPEASVEIWYWLAPATGSLNFSIPNTGSATIVSIAVTGRAASGFTSALDVATGNNGTSTNPTSGAMTTTVNGDIVFAGVATGAQTWAPTGRTGTQIFDTDDGANGGGMQYLLQATAGSTTMSWTFGTSEDWGVVAVAFKEVAAPPADTFLPTSALRSALRERFRR